MYVSTKVDYAIRALAVFEQVDGARVTSADPAGAQGLSVPYMRDVLAPLSDAQIVSGNRLRRSGEAPRYALAKRLDSVTMAQLFKALRLPLTEFHGFDEQPANDGGAVHLRELWVALRATIHHSLERITVSDVMHGRFPIEMRALLEDERSWRGD
jgi:DNA-binding IscR family transcriptional regulator